MRSCPERHSSPTPVSRWERPGVHVPARPPAGQSPLLPLSLGFRHREMGTRRQALREAADIQGADPCKMAPGAERGLEPGRPGRIRSPRPAPRGSQAGLTRARLSAESRVRPATASDRRARTSTGSEVSIRPNPSKFLRWQTERARPVIPLCWSLTAGSLAGDAPSMRGTLVFLGCRRRQPETIAQKAVYRWLSTSPGASGGIACGHR